LLKDVLCHLTGSFGLTSTALHHDQVEQLFGGAGVELVLGLRCRD
jgi:hypothetical protein